MQFAHKNNRIRANKCGIGIQRNQKCKRTMTYYSIHTWTKKHTDLAIERNLTKNAWAMWEWLIHEVGEGKTQTIDLKDFNRYIAKKTGKPLDNRTIKSSAQRLMDSGIVGWENFTQFVRKVTVKSLFEFTLPLLKKKSKDCKLSASNADLDTPNDQFSKEEVKAEAANLSLISEIENLEQGIVENLEKSIEQCQEAGIYFDSEDAVKVLAWEDPQEVAIAIKLFYKRGGHDKITNPEGWMRRCLEKRWFDKPKFSFVQSIIHLANLIGIRHELSSRIF